MGCKYRYPCFLHHGPLVGSFKAQVQQLQSYVLLGFRKSPELIGERPFKYHNFWREMNLVVTLPPSDHLPTDPSSSMATTLPEITDLFATLASHLQTLTLDEEEETCDLLISKLNRSLNLENDGSKVRVLDTALSLMCFKAPQVFDSVIEYTVKTIVTILSSSISCKVLRFQKEEILQIGCSISSYDCVQLIEACTDVIGKLEGFGELSHSLSYAVVRALMSASCYQYTYPLKSIYDVKSVDVRSPAVLKLLKHLPKAISHKKDEIPWRLKVWYLDPLTLKHDVSKILEDSIKRPFLCLDKEFHDRMDWHSIIECLVLSPTMFIETRTLLHNWFLMTGLVSVLELVISLVTVILDVVSRPTWWGISMEMGSKLPFSDAYFPHKHHLLRIFNGPLLSERFSHLVHILSNDRKHWDPAIKQAPTKAASIDHKSSWAMAMNFPEWFFLASILLFSGESFQGDFNSKCRLGASKSERAGDVRSPVSAVAARYIAWILCPFSQSHQDLLCGFLTKISESWTLKQHSIDMPSKETAAYRKKLKKPKFNDNKEDHSLLKENGCQTMLRWLKEFQEIQSRCWDQTLYNSTSPEGKSLLDLSLQQNVLFQKIPLGILIGCSNDISVDGCGLLLHYAATGSVLQSRETQIIGLKNLKHRSEWQEDSIIWTEDSNRKEAITGACLVLNLTDIVEKMSDSMYDSEEKGLDFICRIKARTCKYLINCIQKLLQLKIDENDGAHMLMDLCSRLVQWMHQGREVFEGYKDLDLDDVINALRYKVSSSKETYV